MNTRKLLCAAACGCFVGEALAANTAADNAGDPAYSAGWVSGTNGGTGFAPWSLLPGNPPQLGYFIGSSASNGTAPPSGNIDTAGKAWGMYSNVNDFVEADRKFTGGALGIGQHVLVDFDNGAFDSSANGLVMVSLRSGNNDRFEFFADRTIGAYAVEEQQHPNVNVDVNTAIPFTSDGLHLDFALTGADTFALDVTPLGATTKHFTGTLMGTAGSGIDTFEFLVDDTGTSPSHDAFINSLAVTPEPAALALVPMTSLALLRRRRRA